jgi:hypothetical protein
MTVEYNLKLLAQQVLARQKEMERQGGTPPEHGSKGVEHEMEQRSTVPGSIPLPGPERSTVPAPGSGTLEHSRKVCALPVCLADWPEGWRESFEERAAIIQYDGGLPQPEAERRAEELVREAYRRTGGRP